MKRSIYLGLLLTLGVVSSAQTSEPGPAVVRTVQVIRVDGEIHVEVTLSEAVTPSVEIARHPDRLVLKLPGTISDTQQKRLLVGQLGVRSVRYGLNQPNPPETHLVVDLDQEHEYKLLSDGKKITLVVEAPLSLVTRKRTGPAAAASRPIISTLGRRSDSGGNPSGSQQREDGVLLTPPPSGPPIHFPEDSTEPSPTKVASANPPSAKHPKMGSLQQGTVFPNTGSPGTGEVPPVSGAPKPSGLDRAGVQTSAAANQPLAPAETSPVPAPPPNPAPSEAKETTVALPPTTIAPPPTSPEPVAVKPAEEKRAEQKSAEEKPTEVIPPAPVAAPETAQSVASSTAAPPEPASVTEKPPEEAADQKATETASVPAATPELMATPPGAKPPAEPAIAQETTPKEPATAVVAETTPKIPSVPAQETPEPSSPVAEGSGQGQVQLPAPAYEKSDLRTAFRVKYVTPDAAYLDGGRAAGLTEGMKLVVRNLPNSGAVASEGSDSATAGDVAELVVLSVAETSSVTEIHTPKRAVKIGDLAYLSSADQQSLVEKNALSATRKYPAVISFTENDTLDDEARAEVPKPPLPSVNRARGRIGFDYIGVKSHDGSGIQSSNLGMVVRADITRIGGSYWNVSGYWRGRFSKTSAGPQTLDDLINRTYHIYTTYDNPNSAWVAGFGRLYLPWATSLDTLDGGYVGRRLKRGVTAGVFLGTTPDPTSYSYAPDRQLGGGFVNFEGGSYDNLHYSSTSGGGLKMMSWTPNRPFLFFENGIFYKRLFSVYQSAQLDSQPGYDYTNPDGTVGHQNGTGFGLGRNFLTLRVQVHPRVEVSFNHSYFRDLPTFDPSLIQTGLLDKYLMQGFSVGTRVEIHKQVWLSADLGRSSRTGDARNSLNQMYAITFGHLPWINMHADARYTRFNSSFGSGSYEALSLSKNLGETLQLQILAGQQHFASTLSSGDSSRFVNAMVETALGEHYFVQGGGTVTRGNQTNYEQWIFTFGYRFDNRHGHR